MTHTTISHAAPPEHPREHDEHASNEPAAHDQLHASALRLTTPTATMHVLPWPGRRPGTRDAYLTWGVHAHQTTRLELPTALLAALLGVARVRACLVLDTPAWATV